MKKVKTFFVSLLAVMMVFFCFAGCGETGKYEAVSYNLGALSIDVAEDNGSYVELKGGDVAVVYIKVSSMSWEGEGTWKKGDDGAVTITVSDVTYNATIDGKTMTLDMGIGSIKLEK